MWSWECHQKLQNIWRFPEEKGVAFLVWESVVCTFLASSAFGSLSPVTLRRESEHHQGFFHQGFSSSRADGEFSASVLLLMHSTFSADASHGPATRLCAGGDPSYFTGGNSWALCRVNFYKTNPVLTSTSVGQWRYISMGEMWFNHSFFYSLIEL